MELCEGDSSSTHDAVQVLGIGGTHLKLRSEAVSRAEALRFRNRAQNTLQIPVKVQRPLVKIASRYDAKRSEGFTHEERECP